MIQNFSNLVSKSVSNFCSYLSKRSLTNHCFVALASITGIAAAEAAIMSKPAAATLAGNEPVLLAQQPNSRIAILMCGEYDIIIRYLGGDEFSYQTRGLYLENGDSFVTDNGDIVYDFFNSDFEYRVTTALNGTGNLRVSKYGETIMTRSCSVDF